MTTTRISMLLCIALWGAACAGAEVAPAAEATPMPADATQGGDAAPAPATDTSAAPATPAAQPSAAPMPTPTGGVVVLHKVKDYDAWKPKFDAHEQARRDAGFLGHSLGRVVGDPRRVLVWLPTTDLDKEKAFTESPDLKKVMQDAGVIGLPRISRMTIIENQGSHDPAAKYGALITHRVKDYDAWKPVFDENAAKRTEASVVGGSVNQDPDNSHMVHVWLQATDVEKLNAFLASKDLKAGGVRGAPTITVVELVDMKVYQ